MLLPLGILTPSHYQVVEPNALGSRSGMVLPEVTSFPGCFSYGLGMSSRLGHLGLSHAGETDNCGTWELASFCPQECCMCQKKNLQLEIFLAQEKSVQTKLLFYSS